MEAIKNRYEFVVLFDVENGNPNGDPDAGNMPRTDVESGFGLVTDVCLKRKIRNYVETVKEGTPGYRIYIKDNIPLNASDKEAYEYLGVNGDKVDEAKKKDPDLDVKVRNFMCENFYDVRTFGAVMTAFTKNAQSRPARGEWMKLYSSPEKAPATGALFHAYSRLSDKGGCDTLCG